LIYCPADRYLQEFFIDNNHPPLEAIRDIYEFLRGHSDDPVELTQEDLGKLLHLAIGAEGVGTCERLLEKCGVLERLEPQRNMAAVRIDSDSPTLVDLVPRQASAQRRVAKALEAVVGDRRYERVYFRPQVVAERTEMSVEALGRTLRELGRLEWFDYVPPFRGRAVHMLQRDLPFEKLNVDYDELRRRRDQAMRKLDTVEAYARTGKCRQALVLDYFGEQIQQACGVCDNCQNGGAAAAAPDPLPEGATLSADDPVHQLVLKVLSGIARCQGRFGKTMVVGMLCGSRSTRITRWKLDRLSTFGLLEGARQQDVVELVDKLVQAQLAEQVEVDRFRPVMQLTQRGSAVMRSQAGVPDEVRRGGVVQRLLGHHRPGPAGRAVAGEPQPLAVAEGDAGGGPRPSYYWTWRLLRDGFSVAECLAIRGTDRTTLLEHLVQAASHGCQVDLQWVFPAGLPLPGEEGRADNEHGGPEDEGWSPLERELCRLCSPQRWQA
jgi:ATP-dependent DNA helicase RecQ